MEGHQQRTGGPGAVLRNEQVQFQVHPFPVVVHILYHAPIHDVAVLPYLESGFPIQFPFREKMELRGLVGLQGLLLRLEVESEGIGP